MRTKDILKKAIKEFDGTVIVVSHDREFLDGLVEKVYEFGGGRIKEHLGGIYDFLEKKKIESLRELEVNTKQQPKAAEEKKSDNKISYEERKELARRIKKAERAIATIEEEISNIEYAIDVVEGKLATPEGASDMQLYEEHSTLKKQLDEAMSRWEQATEELDVLNDTIKSDS